MKPAELNSSAGKPNSPLNGSDAVASNMPVAPLTAASRSKARCSSEGVIRVVMLCSGFGFARKSSGEPHAEVDYLRGNGVRARDGLLLSYARISAGRPFAQKLASAPAPQPA